ncbi:MAG: MFS transporter [Clostridiaceae bacterium]|nr:MFS transporter [Clostridiaceae bacterium]
MKFFAKLPRNTQVQLKLEPFNSFLNNTMVFYVPLLMKGVGLAEREIGLIGSIGMVVGVFSQLVAPLVVNALGRRKTLVLGTYFSWVVPMTMWAFVADFAGFLIANMFHNLVRIASLAYYCYNTEDVDDVYKPAVYNYLSLLTHGSGVLALVMVPLVEHFGMIPTVRVLAALSAVVVGTASTIRFLRTTETSVGLEAIAAVRAGQRYRPEILSSLRTVLTDRSLRLLMLAEILWNFSAGMNAFMIIYLRDQLALSASMISFLPAVSAAVGLTAFFVTVRLRLKESSGLLIGSLSTAFSLVMLCFIPPGNVAAVIVFYALHTLSAYVFGTFFAPLFNISVHQTNKTRIFSVVQLSLLTAIIPASYLSGLLYEINPLLIFYVRIGLMLLCALIIVLFVLEQRRLSRSPTH